MFKKFGLALVCLVLVAAGMAAAGFRVERGGSGWPRFIMRSNDDVLEADRAQQRNKVSPPAESASAGLQANRGAGRRSDPIHDGDGHSAKRHGPRRTARTHCTYCTHRTHCT
jgi:hypothetical protein